MNPKYADPGARMNDFEIENIAKEKRAGIDRRTVMTGAAWSLPVIALAVSTPLAAASVGNASIAWSGRNANLLSLGLLGGGTPVTASAGVSVPLQVDITNGPGALAGPLTGTLVTSYASGLPVQIGLGTITLRGFGAVAIPGATINTTSVTRQTIINVLGVVNLGVNSTTQAFAINSPSIASNGTLSLGAISYGVTGRSGQNLLNAGILVTYNITVTIYSGSTAVGSSTSQIFVPLNAGVL